MISRIHLILPNAYKLMCFDRNINGNRNVKFLECDKWSLHWYKNLTLVVNPPERKLTKRTSVQWLKIPFFRKGRDGCALLVQPSKSNHSNWKIIFILGSYEWKARLEMVYFSTLINKIITVCLTRALCQDTLIKRNSYNNFHVSYSEECSSKGGVNAGSCASGFGTCCTCKKLNICPILPFNVQKFWWFKLCPWVAIK